MGLITAFVPQSQRSRVKARDEEGTASDEEAARDEETARDEGVRPVPYGIGLFCAFFMHPILNGYSL